MRTAADNLENYLQGKLVLMGIGNRWRQDDNAGPLLIQRVTGKVRAHCIDAGNAPERHLGEIIREAPDCIVFIDAVDFGGAPGQVAAFTMDDLPERYSTTHDTPLALLMRYVEMETKAAVLLLGIQPFSTGFGVGISAEVEASATVLASLFWARLGGTGENCDSSGERVHVNKGGLSQLWI